MHSTYLNRAKAMPLWEAVVVIAPAGEHDIFAGDIQRVEQREDGEPEQAGHHEVLETKKDSQHCRGQGINNRWEEFECEIKRITSTRLTPQTIGSIESMRTGGGGVGWRTARPAHLILLKGGEHFLMNFRYSYMHRVWMSSAKCVLSSTSTLVLVRLYHRWYCIEGRRLNAGDYWCVVVNCPRRRWCVCVCVFADEEVVCVPSVPLDLDNRQPQR